jgi:hypothetical protein
MALSMAPVSMVWAAKATGCADRKAADGYPTFCQIPATPKNARTPAAFKTAVTDIRQVGRRVVRQTEPETFGLPTGGAEGFAQSARSEIAAFPPFTGPKAGETEAFAADARRQVIPPPKPRRNIEAPAHP